MKLMDIVERGAIVTDIPTGERDDVIGILVDALVSSGAASGAIRDELVRKIIEREEKGSTGFGKGVAVPHVKHSSVRQMRIAIGLSQKGIDFSSMDRQPVYTVFLLLSPADHPEAHLQAMEAVFSRLSHDTFRRFLRQATSVADVVDLIMEADDNKLAR
ncbi:MAG TPA: PTS fructose transporter subunit IIA [Phycisphaerales bacterium]|nr:PTS fructose transporter subunit IIA [Phycisphaerales bacterium]